MFRRSLANGQARRRHECRRGTQECSHHGGPCINIDEYKGLACGSILYIRGCVRHRAA